MLGNFFKFEENGTDIKTEILAGITTFLAMAYILGVNPSMLAEGGMPATGVFFATAISSGIACIIMGLLAAVFLSSMIFLIINISGIREKILNIIPNDLKLGIGAGIGFFLAFLGLKSCGIIIADPSTYVSMGTLFNPSAFLALIGILITLIFYIQREPAAVFFGLHATAIIGVIFTLLGFGVGNALMPTIPAHPITTNMDTSLFCGFVRGFEHLFTNIPNLIIMVFSLVFVTFFDTTGTLMTVGRQCGFVDENGQTNGIEKAFLSDALGGIIGSICGTSTVTAYVESATGIGIGGRTGLTSIVIGIMFLLSIFISPLILGLFTPSVTAAALVIVGILMVGQLREVNWNIKLFNFYRNRVGILNLRYRVNIHRKIQKNGTGNLDSCNSIYNISVLRIIVVWTNFVELIIF